MLKTDVGHLFPCIECFIKKIYIFKFCEYSLKKYPIVSYNEKKKKEKYFSGVLNVSFNWIL